MKRLAYTLALVFALGTTNLGSRIVTASQSARPIEDRVLTAIAAAAQMPALENAVVPPGYREIRMPSAQKMVCCDASPMLRLIEGPGEIRGSLWLFRTLVCGRAI